MNEQRAWKRKRAGERAMRQESDTVKEGEHLRAGSLVTCACVRYVSGIHMCKMCGEYGGGAQCRLQYICAHRRSAVLGSTNSTLVLSLARPAARGPSKIKELDQLQKPQRCAE